VQAVLLPDKDTTAHDPESVKQAEETGMTQDDAAKLTKPLRPPNK
jgi:hypothetical protein